MIIGAACLQFHDDGGTVPVPPLVMVVHTVYHTVKVHCNGAANIKNFF
jgi:hypothetical protein